MLKFIGKVLKTLTVIIPLVEGLGRIWGGGSETPPPPPPQAPVK